MLLEVLQALHVFDLGDHLDRRFFEATNFYPPMA